jgi:hypothetical protein
MQFCESTFEELSAGNPHAGFHRGWNCQKSALLPGMKPPEILWKKKELTQTKNDTALLRLRFFLKYQVKKHLNAICS